jgi:hypothetical protein
MIIFALKKVDSALLQEKKPFEIFSVDEKMLLSVGKSIHRKTWAIEVNRIDENSGNRKLNRRNVQRINICFNFSG